MKLSITLKKKCNYAQATRKQLYGIALLAKPGAEADEWLSEGGYAIANVNSGAIPTGRRFHR